MPEKKLEITGDPSTAKGAYSNGFVVSSNQNEVVIDFVFHNYQQNLLQSRVILTAPKAEELLRVLQQQLEKQRQQSQKGENPIVN